MAYTYSSSFLMFSVRSFLLDIFLPRAEVLKSGNNTPHIQRLQRTFATLAVHAHLAMAIGSFISWHAFNTHNLHPSRYPHPDSPHCV